MLTPPRFLLQYRSKEMIALIILASGSPRRHELLKKIVPEFRIEASDASEEVSADDPIELAIENARLKAEAVARMHPNDLVIGADTIVVLDDEVLLKPHDEADARAMLRRLADREHRVITGLALVKGDRIMTAHEITHVFFGPMTDEQIASYVSTGEPMDKSGSYALQGGIAPFVQKIEGDWSNVVGLPLYRLRTLLERFESQSSRSIEKISSEFLNEIKLFIVRNLEYDLDDAAEPGPPKLSRRSFFDAGDRYAAGSSLASSIPMSLMKLLDRREKSFSDELNDLVTKSGKSNAEIYAAAQIDRRLFSKICNNPSYRPTKLTALALAIALELTLEQTKQFLSRAGYALTHSSITDLVVEFFIEKKIYDVLTINEALVELEQPVLGSLAQEDARKNLDLGESKRRAEAFEKKTPRKGGKKNV